MGSVSETFASNPTGVNYVGLGRDSSTDVTFSDLSLVDNSIPKPSAAMLLGLGGMALLRRRRN